jgi:hypothetical protein
MTRQSALQKAILDTLAWYAAFGVSLTGFEVWQRLWLGDQVVRESLATPRIALSEVMTILTKLASEPHVTHDSGYYRLTDHTHPTADRLWAARMAVAKLERITRFRSLFTLAPFVRVVLVPGSIGALQANEDSDYDIFVIVQAGHIWTARAILLFLFQIFGVRRHGKYIVDRFCLNTLVSTDGLLVVPSDRYAAHEYTNAYFLSGDFSLYQKFFLTNRVWSESLPNFSLPTLPPTFHRQPRPVWVWLQHVGEWLLSPRWVEDKLRQWQKAKIQSNSEYTTPGGYFSITDERLVFLPEPRGPLVWGKYQEYLSNVVADQYRK